MECGIAVVGENLFSTLLGKLSEELATPMLLEFARKEQVDAHLKKWETILSKIQAVLEDAEERQFTDRVVKIWLDELKDLAYDIEDVLDDFSTAALFLGELFCLSLDVQSKNQTRRSGRAALNSHS